MVTRQIAPKRKIKRQEDFTLRDKLAILALHVPGLIVNEERNGSTNDILSIFEIDHIHPCIFGGGREPQNGRPLRKDNGQHKAKSILEKKAAAKTERLRRAHNDEAPKKSKRKIPSRPFPSLKRRLKNG